MKRLIVILGVARQPADKEITPNRHRGTEREQSTMPLSEQIHNDEELTGTGPRGTTAGLSPCGGDAPMVSTTGRQPARDAAQDGQRLFRSPGPGTTAIFCCSAF